MDKSGNKVMVMDIITPAKHFSNRLRDIDSVEGGVENGALPLTKLLAVNTLLTQLQW